MNELAVYLNLARASERRHRLLVRDKLMVLAAVAAHRLGLVDVADYCRQTVLLHNPGHLVRRWPSIAIALDELDFQVYVKRLAQAYPLERAEHMLDLLGIETRSARPLYYTDREYAAAILGQSPAALSQTVDDQARQVASQRASERRESPSTNKRGPSDPWRRGFAALARLFRP